MSNFVCNGMGQAKYRKLNNTIYVVYKDNVECIIYKMKETQ